MRLFLTFMLFLFILPLSAQDKDENPLQTTRQGFGDYRGLNMTVGFVNPKSRTEGSAYYFENWNSTATVYLKEQGRYKIERANINLFDNTLEALYDENSVFTFDTDKLVQIVIDRKIFRPITLDGELRLLELLFNKGVSVYKYRSMSYRQSSPNPMVNRRTNKYITTEKYYLYKDGQLTKMKLTKKAFAKMFQTEAHSEDDIIDYLNASELSLKKEEDLVKALAFVSQ